MKKHALVTKDDVTLPHRYKGSKQAFVDHMLQAAARHEISHTEVHKVIR